MDTATETRVASISVPQQEEELNREVTNVERKAEEFIVETESDYKLASEFGSAIKQKTAQVKAFFKPMKDSAYQAHKAICDREKATLKPLENAEKILKASCNAFIREQERKRREAEEATRKALEAERERKLAEAAAAEAAGNAEKAEEAFNEAVIMDNAKNVATVAASPVKADGSYTKKDWRITGIDFSKITHNMLIAFAKDICAKEFEAYLLKGIRASKGTVKIPGVTYEEISNTVFRR